MIDIDVYQIILRLFCALIAGCLIGVEREINERPAGLRTHALVAFGACSITMISMAGFGTHADTSRVAAQIVSGIGFLGAGTIMKTGDAVMGLTTAASLWVVAGIGMAFGTGRYVIGIASTLGVLLILWMMVTLAHSLRRYKRRRLTIIAPTIDGVVEEIRDILDNHAVRLKNYTISHVNDVYVIRMVITSKDYCLHQVIGKLYALQQIDRIDYYDEEIIKI